MVFRFNKAAALAAITSLIVLSGCSSIAGGSFYAEQEAVPADQALVYVYRMDKYYSKAVTFPFFVDDVQVAKIGNSSYFVVPVEPGVHVFGTRMATVDDEPLEMEVEAGRSYYLRQEIVSKAMGFYAKSYVEPVNEELAQLEMTSCRREVERYSGPDI